MTDSPCTDDETGVADDETTAGTPRWVKVFGAIALAILLLFIILLLSGRGGEHGPGRHGSSGDGGPTAVVGHVLTPGVSHGEQQP